MTEEKKKEIVQPDGESTLEEDLARLDHIAEQLENSSISLEESFRLYQQGMQLLKTCSDRIDTVEKKMIQISEDGEIHEF